MPPVLNAGGATEQKSYKKRVQKQYCWPQALIR